jgi:hypothetical protein
MVIGVLSPQDRLRVLEILLRQITQTETSVDRMQVHLFGLPFKILLLFSIKKYFFIHVIVFTRERIPSFFRLLFSLTVSCRSLQHTIR